MKTWLSSILLVLVAGSCLAGNGGYLGVNISDNHALHQGKVSDVKSGVVITGVIDGTGAAKAGLQADDIILSINGESVTQTPELISYLKLMEPGETVSVKVSRGGEAQSFEVELGERAAMHRHKKLKKWAIYSSQRGPWLGVEFEALNPELAEFFGVEQGILVKRVNDNSPAKNAGLQAGDIITSFDGKTLESNQDLLKTLSSREEGDSVPLIINRRGEAMDLSVTLASAEGANPGYFYDFNFKFDKDLGSLHELPKRLELVQPLLKHLESGSFEQLHQQLLELREEIDQLKRDNKK